MGGRQSSPRSKAGAKWLSKVKKGQVAPKGLHLAHELSRYLQKINFFCFTSRVTLYYQLNKKQHGRNV